MYVHKHISYLVETEVGRLPEDTWIKLIAATLPGKLQPRFSHATPPMQTFRCNDLVAARNVESKDCDTHEPNRADVATSTCGVVARQLP